MASFLDMMVVSPKTTRLDEINKMVAWGDIQYHLKKILARSGFGPSGYDPLQLFKVILLQNLYGLSDPVMEEMLYDRLSFKKFCGFGLQDKIPDETTICRFRNGLLGKTDKLFHLVNASLNAQGIKLNHGTIVDASVIKSHVRPPEGGKVSETDVEAGWTKKGGRFYFGYKAHVASDHKTGLVKRVIATSADVHDSQVFEQLLDGDEPWVTADKAYDSKANRGVLQTNSIGDGILYKRVKGQKEQTQWQKDANGVWSRIRSNIERIFGHWKTLMGLVQTKYKGWEKNQVHFDLVAIAYNLKRGSTLLKANAG